MIPGIISTVGRSLPTLSRRDFLAAACALLLPQRPKGKLDLKRVSAFSPIRFREVAQQSGLDFVLHNNPTPRKHMIETMAGGLAAFDYNNDGKIDIFFTNGAAIPGLEKNSPKFFNRLYRNDGGMKFTDVTQEAGVAGVGYSMGAAAADYNNDGYKDLFVAGVYRNILYRNLGNGKFEDVTEKAGIKSDKWSVAAGWFDYDNDGWLDLFVVNYAHWTPDFDRYCGERDRNLRVYCHPKYFEGLPNTLYRNRRDGTFEDATDESRLAALSTTRSGWSNRFFDFNNDGWKDLFTANSDVNDLIDLFGSAHYKQPNSLFANLGNGTFRDVSLEAGFDLARAHRGSAFADFDNDGKIDIVVSALGEPAELWQNVSPGANRWLILKLIGTRSNRDGIGAKIRLGNQSNHVTTAVGYASSSPSTVHFGTGRLEKIDRVEIRWPSGTVQMLRNVATNQVLEVHEPAK